MNPLTLTLNVGSSSLKFALFEEAEENATDPYGLSSVLRGAITKLGEDHPASARLTHSSICAKDAEATFLNLPNAKLTTDSASEHVLGWLTEQDLGPRIQTVAHRIVHGGESYREATALTPKVIEELADLSPLAPQHQPAALATVTQAQRALPDANHIGCFDTAFHTSQPFNARTYALPQDLRDQGVRHYGFHGLSYQFVVDHLRHRNALPQRLIVAHLGSGASLCAIQDGQSIATTMGMTALDGLPMATRSGTLDPGVVLYMGQELGMTSAEIEDLLYNRSGLRGLSGVSGDVSALAESSEAAAVEALDYFAYWVNRHLGSMCAALGGVDALAFTGGIGENSGLMRDKIWQLAGRWLTLETEAIHVIKTDEEAVMAHQARTNPV